MNTITKYFILFGAAGLMMFCLSYGIIDGFSKHEEVTLPTFESLIPKFRVRTNSPTSFQVEFKAYNSKDWVLVETVLPTPEAAQRVIDSSINELRLQYEISAAIFNSLKR